MAAEAASAEQANRNAFARFLELIRFSHTIFALPFALGALLVAANGRPSLRMLLLVLACMVLARTAAMLFNRVVDWSIDQRNPRTAGRHRLASRSNALSLLVVCSAAFIVTASAINWLTASCRRSRSPSSSSIRSRNVSPTGRISSSGSRSPLRRRERGSRKPAGLIGRH